jgi:hypothetical protein
MTMQKTLTLLPLVLFLFSFAVAFAQEDGTSTSTPASDERLTLEQKESESPAAKGLSLDKEVKPRLPNGFGGVVDASQKEAIYKIQKDYNTLIALLKLRVELLEKERNAKVEAVLTPEQLEKTKVRRLRR